MYITGDELSTFTQQLLPGSQHRQRPLQAAMGLGMASSAIG